MFACGLGLMVLRLWMLKGKVFRRTNFYDLHISRGTAASGP
jgi:hypothetical protein